jgi:hypothetical protein
MSSRVVVALVACLVALPSRAEPPPGRPTVTVTRTTVGGKPVVVVTPVGTGPWPVVFVMGGLGELSRGEAVSAGAWVDDYGLVAVLEAVQGNRLDAGTFQGLVDARLLRQYRQRVARGYKGLVIVGVPAPVDYSDEFVRFVTDELIPWADRTLPVRHGAEFRGIDGVSLGARHALRLGLAHPELFRTVSGVQAAVRGWHDVLLELATEHRVAARRLSLSLITSDGDPYRPAVGKLARSWRRLGLSVRHGVGIGPHNRRYNSGPGAVDLVLFHDAVLNGTSAPSPFNITHR